MHIAITSQNFRTISGHAGKARRFLVYEVAPDTAVCEKSRLDLPLDMAMHGFDKHRPHPLDGVNVLITAGSGEGFAQRMAQRGVRVVTTAETDPEIAVHAFLAGCIKPALGDAFCDRNHHHNEGH